MGIIMLCVALALLGSCSSHDASRSHDEHVANTVSSLSDSQTSSDQSISYAEQASVQDWDRLAEAIRNAQAYEDASLYTKDAWLLFEDARHRANRTMMEYPNGDKSSVQSTAQQLETCMLILSFPNSKSGS